MLLNATARAKINLTLHVLGRRADGMHELESLVAFADLADQLTLDTDQPLGLTVSGPTAQTAGAVSDNLVLKSVEALRRLVPNLRVGAFDLSKHLPVAAGIGGGSADAAAALRLLAEANGLRFDDARVIEAARAVGADVPVCLESVPRMMRGSGERLGPALPVPPMHAVLINPGVPVATVDVFRELGLRPGEDSSAARHMEIAASIDTGTLVAAIAAARNDLQTPAIRCAPAIAEVLELLAQQHRCQLARMSGSGATCFGLFPTMSSAFQAVRAIRRLRGQWWVQPAVIGG
jgi:4-diphosphocytidyl-2-C-methyl-D-erythritol kinase